MTIMRRKNHMKERRRKEAEKRGIKIRRRRIGKIC